MKYKAILMLGLLATSVGTQAQNFGNSDPSPVQDCGIYQWPEVVAPCPEVQIKQKHDHTPMLQYRNGEHPWSNNPNDKGWDTVVDCINHQLELSCMPYIPVQYFNGGYYVDVIPYNPPDTTFYLNGQGTQMDINCDDVFAPSPTSLDFPFFFFGQQKTQFRLGDNGMVTFTTTPMTDSHCSTGGTNKPYCPWSFDSGLPWTTSDGNFDRMHDVIFGVYEDSHPLPTTISGNQGVYYGVVDEYPCRKIIASWNQIPLYSSQTNNRETYQIVCYEGSNIIEVHVKRRGCCSSTNSGRGIIGIMNATGQAQVPGTLGQPNAQVQNGSPAAFWPVGKNNYATAENNTAYRFTPRGNTSNNYEWFRIFDNGDTVHLSTDPTDTNGYIYPMGSTPSCPTLTRAVVSPTRVSRYCFHLKFKNANGDWYNLFDTIVIGVDTANNTSLTTPNGNKEVAICAGQTTNLSLKYPATQKHDTVSYTVKRISDGQHIVLDAAQVLNFDEWTNGLAQHSQTLTVRNNLPTTGLRQNKIDTLIVQASINFVSGCTNYDTMMVRIFPNFDTTEVVGICHGQSYVWSANGTTYTNSAEATAQLQSTPGCDSTVHLKLTVFNTSYTIDQIEDCKPYTWINGVTYNTSNTATAAVDTILLQNEWGCDSVVQLEFSLLPVTALIQSSRSYFDFDNLGVELTDISLNNHSRMWVMPDGSTQTGIIAYYYISAEMEEADIELIATSAHGCSDTTHIILPLRKESFWMPNAFTPDNANGNNLFHSVSLRTVTEEMFIYNRNGQLVFKCEGPDCPWDGKDLDGRPCPQGTYTYFVRYTNEFTPNRTFTRKGTVTLIR